MQQTLGRAPARAPRAPSSIACLAFVGVLAAAFWAGALWIGNVLLHLLA
jgi:hypothetical protein